MKHSDLVALLEGGVTSRGGRWADLGAGEGAFTLALADLVGPDAHITAIDKDASALRGISRRFETRVADFTTPLDLHDLDGVVMANSLHFVRDKQPVLEAVRAMLKPGGRLVMPLGQPGWVQKLVRVTKHPDGTLQQSDLGEVRFVPLIGEEGWNDA